MREERQTVARARGLVKRYGPVEAVAGIDFTIRPRECYGFLGPNGAGKTTTIRMVTCRIPRTAGELEVLGRDVDEAPAAIKAQMGVVSQENNLDESLTVLENLYVYGRYHGLSHQEALRRSHELLELMQLEGKARVRPMHLSGGMKRRLAIARALVNRPRLVVLDEPTTGLDPQARLLVWQRLAALKEAGVTLILTTHYMEEAARLCDRVAIVDQGGSWRRTRPTVWWPATRARWWWSWTVGRAPCPQGRPTAPAPSAGPIPSGRASTSTATMATRSWGGCGRAAYGPSPSGSGRPPWRTSSWC